MRIFIYVPDCDGKDSIIKDLSQQFQKNNRQFDFAASPDDLVSMQKHIHCDVILVVIDDKIHGAYEILSKLQNSNVRTPVLCLTRNQKAETFFNCVSRGALASVPYSQDIFERDALNIFLKNAHLATNYVPTIYNNGPIEVDFHKKTVRVDGSIVSFTNQEFLLFELLASQNNGYVTKDELYDRLYPFDDEKDPQIIQVIICKLRKKLSAINDDDLGDIITTTHGVGYAFMGWNDFLESREENNVVAFEPATSEQTIAVKHG